jgi:hypothetical protein
MNGLPCGSVYVRLRPVEVRRRRSGVSDRDGNSARGRGYPQVPYPMGMDTGKKSRPRVRIRTTLLTRG